MNEMGEGIQEFLKNTLQIEDIDQNTALIDDGYIDSIQILDLAMFIEETYQVTLDADDMMVENFASIDAIVTYISQKIKDSI